MKKLDDLEAQKDELIARQAQEKANLNNKIRAEKERQKREREREKSKKQRDASYTVFQAEDEDMSLKNLIKELKKIVEEKENDNTK